MASYHRTFIARRATAAAAAIKDHLKALSKAGHLELHGAGRGTWYGTDLHEKGSLRGGLGLHVRLPDAWELVAIQADAR